MHIADRLGVPVGILREQTSPREFFRWQEYINMERDRTEKAELMMAQLTFQVYLLRYIVQNMFAKQAGKLEHETALDFLMGKKIKPKKKKLTIQQLQERAQLSHDMWFSYFTSMGGQPATPVEELKAAGVKGIDNGT